MPQLGTFARNLPAVKLKSLEVLAELRHCEDEAGETVYRVSMTMERAMTGVLPIEEQQCGAVKSSFATDRQFTTMKL